MTDLLENEDLTRTDMSCHNCNKIFIAEIDYRIDGDHVLVCPYCGHEHFRTIEKGKISEKRWNSRNHEHNLIRTDRVWKATTNPFKMQTSSAAVFIRDKWLNFGQG